MTKENKSINSQINLIKNANFKITLRNGVISIKVIETESNALFFTLIILFILDGLTILIYFQLLKIIEGIISFVIELIIISLLVSSYSQYNDIEAQWKINSNKKKINLLKVYKERKKEIILDFKNIESICISQGKVIKDRYYLSILLENSKRYKILYDNEQNTRLIGRKISELIDRPMFERSFFKTIILHINFIFLYLIIMAIILSIFDLELILELLMILFFRNIMLLISFIDVYLIKEYIKENRDYKKKLSKSKRTF